MIKLIIPGIVVLAYAFNAAAAPNAETLDFNLSTGIASYAVGDAGPADSGTSEQSYYEWARDNVYFIGTFGFNAAKWLMSGIYDLAKSGLIGMGSKYVSDLLAVTATAIVATYLNLSPTTTVVTGFFIKELAKKVVGTVRAEMAKRAAPISDAVASKLESIVFNVFESKLPTK